MVAGTYEGIRADSQATAPSLFATTHWSVVQAAGKSGAPDAHAALERLCQTGWPPLYAFLRRFGCSPEDAQDLTQDFFAHFLERDYLGRADRQRGRFRAYLLTSLQHYLRDAHDRRTAAKRGGGAHVLSLDRERVESGYAAEPVARVTPERVFEKRRATTLLGDVLAQVGAEFARTGRRGFFDQLKGYVWGEQGTTPVRECHAIRRERTQNHRILAVPLWSPQTLPHA